MPPRVAERIRIEREGSRKRLYIAGDLPAGFHGEATGSGFICPLDERNGRAVRAEVPWTRPQLVGLRRSFGFGDRLGVATPGHLAAVEPTDLFPVLAQQSIREMERAGRSPQQVLDDVTWAVLETDYRGGFGCDADHVKTSEEIDACIDAGYVAFTLDPGRFVDDEADAADAPTLENKLAGLPWDLLDSDHERNEREYVSKHGFSRESYARAAVKYGPAIARVAELQRHIADRLGKGSFDLEVSVDETDTPTTPDQHRYIVLELNRLGIDFAGLAPRFVGDFYKGVDYVGDLDSFEADYRAHAEIARELGPYKLSIHSGSDKLNIYPIIDRHSPEYVHVKTSGTSWLEALRVVAAADPKLFRNILQLALDGYDRNRRSYHLSGEVDRIPKLSDEKLPELLDHFHARQVLHVAFGPVLASYYDEFYSVLRSKLDAYHAGLRVHFGRHLQPFTH